MAFSYDPTLADDISKVRFLIQDTVKADALVQDEEIEWLVSTHTDVYIAAASACEALALRFAREPDSMSADGLSISGGFRVKNYQELADKLRAQASRVGGAVPYAGGILVTEHENNPDPDVVPLHFRSHIHDHPESGDTDPWNDVVSPS